MKRVAAAFVTLSFALAGCGAAETESTTPASKRVTPRSRPFAQQAASICQQMQAGAGVISSGRKPTDAEFGRLLGRWRAGFDRLGRLDAPSTRAKPFNEMLRHYRTMVTALAAAKEADDESVLADFAAAVVEGTRGSRASRRAGLPGCAFFPEIKQPPRDPEPALAATRALVPAGAHVFKADTPDCNAEASCRIEFGGSGSRTTRLRSLVAALRAHGWTHVETGRSPTGSSWATAYRNDYQAEIELLDSARPTYCADARPEMFGCSDSVWVHRVEIPQVLTGG